MKDMTQEINAKEHVKRENAAAAEAESTLAEAEAQEIERSMKCSSTEADQRRVPTQPEHRRQDGWTSTPCGSDDEKKDSERDMTAGERLQKQRPHGDDHPEHNSEEHLVAQVPHQGEEAGSIVLHSSSNASEFNQERQQRSTRDGICSSESE